MAAVPSLCLMDPDFAQNQMPCTKYPPEDDFQHIWPKCVHVLTCLMTPNPEPTTGGCMTTNPVNYDRWAGLNGKARWERGGRGTLPRNPPGGSRQLWAAPGSCRWGSLSSYLFRVREKLAPGKGGPPQLSPLRGHPRQLYRCEKPADHSQNFFSKDQY